MSKFIVYFMVFWQVLNCSAYTHTGNPTASGEMPYVGVCAVDYINGIKIPFGTRITLPNGIVLIVKDRFGAGHNNHLDIFMDKYDECIDFGRQHLNCKIEVPDGCKRIDSYSSYRVLR